MTATNSMTVDPMDRSYVRSALTLVYASFGVSTGGRGSGPADIEYYVDKVLESGGWTAHTVAGENNIGYWTDRIKNDLVSAGYAIGNPKPNPPPPPPAADQPTPATIEPDRLDGLIAETERLVEALSTVRDAVVALAVKIDALALKGIAAHLRF